MRNRHKFDQAADASSTIIDAMDTAARHLWTGDRCFNGYGVLPDPSSVYGRLYDAKAQIDKAMAAYRATTWPTNADYEAAER
jgi:hypothetical protein